MTAGLVIPANPAAPWFEGPAVHQIEVTKPGQVSNRTPLTVAGVAASWRVSGPTSLSTEVLTSTLIETFQTVDLRAYWLFWTHPRLGTWGGEISECEADLATGTTEIAARDFSALLDSRRVHKVYDIPSATPGAIVKAIITGMQRDGDGYSHIRTINAEETGESIPFQFRGGKVIDALRTLESKSGDEWYVDDQRRLWWMARRGRNKTASVSLVEGIHIVRGRYSVALGPIVNDLLVVPANQQYAISQSFSIQDDASIKKIGLRQDQLTYTIGVTESALRPVAQKDLRRLTKLGDVITFDLQDVDGCFAWFGDGDVIRLLLPSINKRLDVRVMARSYDTGTSTLTVTGDVESSA